MRGVLKAYGVSDRTVWVETEQERIELVYRGSRPGPMVAESVHHRPASLRHSKKRPGPDEPARGAFGYLLPSAVVLLSGEDRGDLQRRVRVRDDTSTVRPWFCA